MTASVEGKLSLAVIILTFNEERHIARAIESVRAIARDIVVIDSLSTDTTVAIAERLGARILRNPFVNQAVQLQWGLDHAHIDTDWIFRLDADEIVEADLVDALGDRLPGLPGSVVGINLQRKHIFMDRWIRHGGRYPLAMLRIWRNGHGQVENRWMDEHMVVSGGGTITLAGGFADWNLQDLTYFTRKHDAYATREAVDVLLAEGGAAHPGTELTSRTASRSVRVKRAIKERLYNRLPFGTGPLLFFLFRYIVQLGFLDGKPGLIYHVLQGFWYRFLVDAKLVELRRGLSGERGKQLERRLAELTGLRIGGG